MRAVRIGCGRQWEGHIILCKHGPRLYGCMYRLRRDHYTARKPSSVVSVCVYTNVKVYIHRC